MTSSIEGSNSAWLCEDSRYCINQAATFTKEVFNESLPGVLAIKGLASLFLTYINPAFLFNDELTDPESEDFLVTQENKEAIAYRILQDRVTFAADIPLEQQQSYRQSLHATFVKMLGERIEKIETIAQKMGITRPVQYAISMPSTPVSIPYRCLGDKFSLHNPVINAIIPEMRITSTNIASQPIVPNPAQQARQEFILAHEIAHIAKGDVLLRTITTLALGALNVWLWSTGMVGAAPLATKIIVTLVTTLCVHAVARLFYIAISRHQEHKADELAFNTLGSSEGAEVFFSSYIDNPADLEHPAISTRLTNAKAWQATH